MSTPNVKIACFVFGNPTGTIDPVAATTNFLNLRSMPVSGACSLDVDGGGQVVPRHFAKVDATPKSAQSYTWTATLPRQAALINHSIRR